MEQPTVAAKPALQKPPGYRDLAAPAPAAPRFAPRAQPPRGGHLKRGHPRRPRRCFRRCCCCLFISILLLLLASAIVGGLSYLWFQPKLPSFRLESIQISKFNVSSKSDGSFLDASSITRIRITNPNKKISLSLAAARLSVAVTGGGDGGDVSLGGESFPNLALESRNSSLVRVETKVRGAAVEEMLGRRLASQFRSRNLRLSVEINTKVVVPGGGSMAVPVRILCGGVSLKEMDGGAAPKCRLSLFKLINLH